MLDTKYRVELPANMYAKIEERAKSLCDGQMSFKEVLDRLAEKFDPLIKDFSETNNSVESGEAKPINAFL